jgi:hypothetical protein
VVMVVVVWIEIIHTEGEDFDLGVMTAVTGYRVLSLTHWDHSSTREGSRENDQHSR